MRNIHINFDIYPLHQPESPAYQSLIAQQQYLLNVGGMINLANFLTPKGVDVYTKEIHDRAGVAFHNVSQRHPYGYEPSPELPDDHPRNTFGPTESHRLARHHFENSALDELYCWQPMRQFIADITGESEIFLSGDPSNGLVIQVYREGFGQAWHFDQALYSTILNMSESEAGGIFECVPNLRSEDSPNYEEVKSVLDGQSTRIQKHKVQAGSFTIMNGRHTLHRVTRIEKSTPRISAVLSYELLPNQHMDLKTRRISFGPSAPAIATDS